MKEHHFSEEDRIKRDRLRSEVIMPDKLEKPKWNVGGAKEYNRSTLVVIFFGILLLAVTFAVLLFTGRIFFILAVAGMGFIFWGLIRLGSDGKS